MPKVVDKTKVQEMDIVKLYDAVVKLSEQVSKISGRLSTLETIVNELEINDLNNFLLPLPKDF